MHTSNSLYFGVRMSEQKDIRMFPPVPMVYEQVPAEPQQWEYKVLTVDTREEDLPGVEDLNELGNVGWLLVGSVRGGTTLNPFDEPGSASRLRDSERQKVYYYFVRQKQS
jgi:hypothetical protein